MIETADYYIYEDSFIFKPYFNGIVNDYINIISNYKKIFFSNYNEPQLCVETNNKYYDIYRQKHIYSYFNKPLSDSLNNQIQLQQLTFGSDFNQPLGNSLKNLTNLQELTFGGRFNKPLGDSLNNQIQLQKLTFGSNFNQPLGNSLNNLTNLQELTFGLIFNHPLYNSLNNLTKLHELTLDYEFNQQIEIPTNIKILKLNCNNKNLIDNLPNSIEELYLLNKFYLELNNLPNSIKIISFYKDSKYNKELNNLPLSIEKIYLPNNYQKKINNINSKCLIIYNYL